MSAPDHGPAGTGSRAQGWARPVKGGRSNDGSDLSPVVRRHLDAFNARDLDGLLSTFADDAVFATGDHLVVGRRGINALFADAFRDMRAELTLLRWVAAGDTTACELAERVTFAGVSHDFALAGFYTVRDGALVRVKVYREGSPDL